MSAAPAIDAVQARTYVVPTDAPEADGTLAWDSTTMVLVRVAAGGETGIGWTYGPPACASLVQTTLADAVVGRKAMDVNGCFEAMRAAVRNVGRPGVASYAMSAVDVALWDLKARLLQVPMAGLLGRVQDSVRLYGSGGFTSYDEKQLAEQVSGWCEAGATAVKIKIGESWGSREDRDLARMRQVRDLVGDGVELFVDANGGYSAKQAVRVCRRAEDLDVRWLEEPVSSDHLEQLREVRTQVAPDVTAGEYGTDSFYFRRMCAADALDCLQVDATRCGGYTGWLRAVAIAAAYGLDVSAHCAPHLHAPVAAATPGLRHIEWFHDHQRIESMFFDGIGDVHDGRLTPQTSVPGLGLALRESDTEQFRVA